MSYLIEFRLPGAEAPLWAGMHKGAFGWAPQKETANHYDDRETAERVLANAYGSMAEYGSIIKEKK